MADTQYKYKIYMIPKIEMKTEDARGTNYTSKLYPYDFI